jgi:L-lactate dehydrogenase complex protein LldG
MAKVSSKEAILNKISSALQQHKVPMPYPEAEADSTYPFVQPAHIQELAELFAAEFTKLGGKFIYCGNEQELLNQIVLLADNFDWKHVHCREQYYTNKLQDLQATFIRQDENLEGLQAAITTCKYAVARLGSLIVTADNPAGRALPVYTPVHVCIVYNHQVLFDLADVFTALQKEYGNNYPSMVNIATGPSRTADIEKTLVVGVHGPKEVYVLFVDELV